MQEVILIRHAESESNIGNVFEHQNIIKITKTGIKQAYELLEVLNKPDRIICSKYIRSIETAEPLMKKYPDSETHIWLDIHEFQPIDTRKYAGVTREERDFIAKIYWDKLNPIYFDGGNSESFKAFVDRVNSSILKMKKLEGLNYIFSHGNFIRCTLVLLNHFKQFNHIEKTDEIYQQIMRNFAKSYQSGEIPIKNTEVFDISKLLINYQ